MTDPGCAVFLVGPRYRQHSTYSGYESFHRYIGEYLPSPVAERWPERRGITGAAERLLERTTKPAYSIPILRIEMAAAQHMLRHRGAVYHVLYGETDVLWLGRWARRTGNAVIASFHDGAKVCAETEVDERLLRTLAGAVILGETQREFFESQMPADRVFVVPHGVDTTFFAPEPGVVRERVCITAGGHTRDYETFEEAIRLVWKTDPDVRFVAIGANIGNKGTPFALDGVEFRDGISDQELRRAYQTASVAAFSFEWAVANNSLLEAMSSGLPIVATDVGGVGEYVGPDGGLLFGPRDPEGMADAIRCLLNDPARARRMGDAARARVEALEYRQVAQRLGEVYRTVADRLERPRSGSGRTKGATT